MKLWVKLLVFFIPLTLLVMGAVTHFSRASVHRILIREYEMRGIAQSQDRMALAKGFELKSEMLILQQLQRIKEQVAGSYMIALDQNGKVLAHTNVTEQGKIYRDALTLRALDSPHVFSQEIDVQGMAILDITLPIWEWKQEGEFLLSGGRSFGQNRVGTLRLGLPLRQILQFENRIYLRQIGMILLAIGCVSAGLIVFLMRMVLRPIQFLLSGISQVSGGKYGGGIAVLSRDELGDLTQCFNKMSRILASTTVSKDYVDAILQHMLEPLFVLRPDGLIGMLNPAMTHLLGYCEEELLGKSTLRLFPEGQHPYQGELLDKCLQGNVICGLEVPMLSKDNRRVPVLFSSAAFKDKQGQIIGVVCTARDITERKKMQDRIMQYEKMSAVGKLAAGVAHEINNPLGVILGFVQGAIKRLKKGDSLTLPLKSIERESLRCKELVQNLLTFSRKSKDEQKETTDLNLVIEEVLTLMEIRSRAQDINLIKDMAPELPKMLANRLQIEQAMINLTNNAMDAMPRGGRLTVRTAKTWHNGADWLLLEIEDTGMGIPKEIQSKIFEPFFTTKEIGKGTGLGLSLVHEIVQSHQGVIEVRSRVNQGTTFTLRFPACLDTRHGQLTKEI